MKKNAPLLLSLFMLISISISGQNAASKLGKESTLTQLKKQREMIMRSDNHAFKVQTIRYMNQSALRDYPKDVDAMIQKSSQLISGKMGLASLYQGWKDVQLSEIMPRRVAQDDIMKFSLDSIVTLTKSDDDWVPSFKNAFDYNYHQQILLSGQYGYVESDWKGDRVDSMAYDDDGRVSMYMTKEWNDELNRWIIDHKRLIEYDEEGRVVVEEGYADEWIEESGMYVYKGNYKQEYAFNEAGGDSLWVYYEWNMEQEDWVYSFKNEMLYEDGLELMFSSSTWNLDESKWEGHWKFEHSPVEGLPVMNSIYYSWDYEGDDWYINSKETYEVSEDEHGMVVINTYYQEDYQTMELVPSLKIVYSNPHEMDHIFEESFQLITTYQWNSEAEIPGWMLESKSVNTSDSFDNVISKADSIWVYDYENEVFVWLQDRTMTATVNEVGDVTEKLVEDWYYDLISGDVYLSNKFKYLYAYDDIHQMVEEIIQMWSFDSDNWKNNTRNTYAYDENGNTIENVIYESYDVDAGQWIPDRKFEYGFDDAGVSTMNAYYSWMSENEDWQLQQKNEEIDTDSLIITSNIYWSNEVNKVVVGYREERRFDEEGRLLLDSYVHTDMHWDGSDYYAYVEGEKTVIEYDDQKRISNLIEYRYQDEGFVEDEKLEFTYLVDHPTVMDTETAYAWNTTNSTWELVRKGVLTSNFDVERSQMLLPFEDSREVVMYFNYMPVELVEYMWSESDWVEYQKTVVYFSENAYSLVDEVDAATFNIMPNPVSDIITFKLPEEVQQATLHILNLQGKSMVETTINNRGSVDVSGLETGIYFYQIKSNQQTYTGKLIKK